MKNIIVKFFLVTAIMVLPFSCQLVDDQVPQNSLAADKAIVDSPGARAALMGAYDILQSANYYGTRYLLFPDMMGGNLTWTGTFPSFGQIANRATLPDNAEVTNMWNTIYNGINRVNQILDKAAKVTDPAFTDKNQILAEASFLRAFHYHNLVRSWGGVPLKLTPTDAVVIADLQMPKATPAEVYTQILADLNFALTTFPTTATGFGGRANIPAARALKARVHLYRSSMGIANEWTEAINEATLAGASRTLAPVYGDLFSARSTTEVIWFVESNSVDQNSIAFFLLPSTSGGRNELRPSGALAGAYNVLDVRRIQTTTINASLKYFRVGTGDDYALIFRLAEMLLIRAEALVERNTGTDLADATTLLNQIRNRAGIGDYTGAATQAALRDEIFVQRRLELALEGHYFFDIVRTNRAAALLTSPVWNPNQALFPFPQREVLANPNLVQNPGY